MDMNWLLLISLKFLVTPETILLQGRLIITIFFNILEEVKRQCHWYKYSYPGALILCFLRHSEFR